MPNRNLRKFLRRYPLIWKTSQLLNNSLLMKLDNLKIIDDREDIADSDQVIIDWPNEIPKPFIGLIRDYRPYPYWTKYEKFLQTNHIPFEYYEIHNSHWLEDAAKFDLIVGTPDRGFSSLEELRMKLITINHFLKIDTYPSIKEITIYENKLLQFECLKMGGFPVVSTFATFDYEEANKFLDENSAPFISKLIFGSGSTGVELVKSTNNARKITRTAFSRGGRSTYYPDCPQKGYVYFQEFIKNAKYDLRIIVVGDFLFGYYRYPIFGDFRGSGSGAVEYKDLPQEARDIAIKVAKFFDFPCLAVDFVETNNIFQIIELSSFTDIDERVECAIQGIEGCYQYLDENQYKFISGKFWLNEFALRELLSKKFIQQNLHL